MGNKTPSFLPLSFVSRCFRQTPPITITHRHLLSLIPAAAASTTVSLPPFPLLSTCASLFSTVNSSTQRRHIPPPQPSPRLSSFVETAMEEGGEVKTDLFKYNKPRTEGGRKQSAFIKQHVPSVEKPHHRSSQKSSTSSSAYLQGFCTEYKVKLSKVDYVCLTPVCSETVGGLPGLLLTLAGIEKGPTVKIWVPADLRLSVAAMKTFVPHVAIKPEFPESVPASHASHAQLSEEPMFVCENRDVKISAILIQPKFDAVPALKACDVAVIYLCELAEIKGKFHRDRALALGVKPGPKYARLQNKKTVKSDALDIAVQLTDVMDPPIPGPVVLIVDCRTTAHAEKLVTMFSLTKYYSGPSAESASENKVVNCIVHLTPAAVVCTAIYQSWMKKFCAAEHVMAGHSMNLL